MRDVVGSHAVARRAHRARRRAAAAARRVEARGDGRPRLVGGVDAGDEHRLGADVEHALQIHVVVPRHAHDADGRRRGHRVQLRGEARRVAQAVLLVEHEVVEAGKAQDLGHLRMPEHRPAAQDLARPCAGAALRRSADTLSILLGCNAIFYVLPGGTQTWNRQ